MNFLAFQNSLVRDESQGCMYTPNLEKKKRGQKGLVQGHLAKSDSQD